MGQALAFLLSYASTQFLRSGVILKVDLATYWQIRGRELMNWFRTNSASCFETVSKAMYDFNFD